MPMRTQLMDDMKQAMKSRDTVKLGAIRFLLSEVKNYEIDNGEQDDEGILKLIGRQVKQMKDAVSEFEKGGREDLVAEEQQKIAVLEAYLPKQMSDEELKATVKRVIDAIDPSQRQMGPVMQQVRQEVEGKADGGRVAAVVKELLS